MIWGLKKWGGPETLKATGDTPTLEINRFFSFRLYINRQHISFLKTPDVFLCNFQL